MNRNRPPKKKASDPAAADPTDTVVAEAIRDYFASRNRPLTEMDPEKLRAMVEGVLATGGGAVIATLFVHDDDCNYAVACTCPEGPEMLVGIDPAGPEH